MALITSNGTGGGLASATTTWTGGVVPVEGDSVQILAGDVVEIDGAVIWGDDTITAIEVFGELTFSNSISTSLTCNGLITIKTGGSFIVGTSTSPIPANINVDILLGKSAVLENNKYGFLAEGGSTISLVGSVNKPITARSTTGVMGFLSFTVDDLTNWNVGDDIYAKGVNRYDDPDNFFNHTIADITGNAITLDGTSDTSLYLAPNSLIYNKERNINIRHFDPAFKCGMEIQYFNNASDTTLREFKYVRFHSSLNGNSPVSSDYWRTGFDIYNKKSDAALLSSKPFVSCSFDCTLGLRNVFQCEVIGSYISYIRRVESPKTKIKDCIVMDGRVGWGDNYLIECDNIIQMSSHSGMPFIGNAYSSGYTVKNSTIQTGWNGLSNSPGGQALYHNCTFVFITNGFVHPDFAIKTDFVRCDYKYPSGYNNLNGETLTSAVSDQTFEFILIKSLGHFQEIFYEKGSVIRHLDARGNPKWQTLLKCGGLLSRDHTVFNSSVASIKFEPMHSELPLKYSKSQKRLAGQSFTVSVYVMVDSSYTSTNMPQLRVVSNEYNLSVTHSGNFGQFELLTINAPTLINNSDIVIELVAYGTNSPLSTLLKGAYAVDGGKCWFDDLVIDNVLIDIGQELFQGGTEISTVVDITDTNKYLTISNIIPGSIVEIYDNEVANIGNNDTLLASTNNSGATFTYTHNGTPNDIRILVLKPGYVEQILDFTLANADQGLIVNQVVDNND